MRNFSNFFHEAVKALGVSNNLNMPSYSHSDPVNNAVKNMTIIRT